MTDLADMTERLIPLSGTFNVRDVGGYPTPDGPIAWGRLLRADALHRLDDEGRSRLTALGLRTVIDLRREVERDHRPDALDGMTFTALHLPILGGDLVARFAELPTLADVYTSIVDAEGRSLAAVVSALAEPDGLTAVVHCTAGKDRTGIVVAMVLDMLGVDDEIIAADYAASATLLRSGFELPRGTVSEMSDLPPEVVANLLGSPPELILGVLSAVRTSHGSVEQYLVAQGMAPTVPAQLRQALIQR